MKEHIQAVWYRSNVKLKGTQIIPVPPFQAYNPFDFYYSFQATNRGKKSLYLEFLDVDVNNPNAILNFCERFGVLGHSYPDVLLPYDRVALTLAESIKLIPKKVKKDYLANTSRIKLLWAPIVEHSRKLELENAEGYQEYSALLNQLIRDSTTPSPTEICFPMTIGDFVLAQFELKSALNPNRDNARLSEQDHRAMMIGQINQELYKASVRPYLRWDLQRGHVNLGWESHSLRGILWLMVMFDVLGPGNILACPWCKKIFLAHSQRVRFCSFQCCNSFKVRAHKLRNESRGHKSLPKKSASRVPVTSKKMRGAHGTKKR